MNEQCQKGFIPCPGTDACIPLETKCDLHPNCPDGSDEKGCFDEYKRRNLIAKSSNFECESPHFNKDTKVTIKILATKCDGQFECYQGKDEEGCSISWESTCGIGKN